MAVPLSFRDVHYQPWTNERLHL